MFTQQLLALTALAAFTSAHSWVEEYQVISDNGSYTGPLGYTRGFVPRTDPTFDGFSMMWLQPNASARNDDGTTRTRIDSTDYVCAPQQRKPTYTSGYPKLQVSPGDYVAMKYLENGHVSLPWNITGKPESGGTVFIFGTTKPSENERLADVMQWNKEGTSGNKNGFLLAAQNYDDGRCHQINCGSISQQRQMLQPNHAPGQMTSTLESWCESDVQIPEKAAIGTLTIYWVWQFPTAPNVDCNQPAGKDEYYTSCADFDVVKPGTPNKLAASPDAPASGNPQSVAVKNYKSRPAHTSVPAAILQENNKIVGNLQPVDKAFVSSCTAQASIISQNNLNLWPEVYVPNSCSAISTFGSKPASAAAAEFSKAAASYAAGSKAAWEAAFAKAKFPLPTRPSWSDYAAAPSAQPVATSAAVTKPSETAATPSGTASSAPSAPSPSPAPSSAAGTAGGDGVVTLTTVVVITSTLGPGEPIPTGSSTAASSPAASTSAAPSYPPPASSPPALSSALPTPTFSAGEDSAPIPTITSLPGSDPAAPSGAMPAKPANGTVPEGRYRRWHARNFG
ncbi:unnamed protein product [Zymoseptoria tritici ST99CH_1A5]|uniref:DUF7492 domain-containing protein n=2 Tax=Zymoseptoria tritici TaxID=1047171 RepID=A0A1Y6L2E2_ZYMTR|nr:unnamed protein product [Zymoseptoria tritici ST99CH_3D1]SMY18576.1 unnamed protein product [Zymoseptoria tritici ST99CH_1A5]